MTYHALDMPDDGISYCEMAIKQRPGFAEAICSKAEILCSIGNIDESRKFLDGELRLNPKIQNHDGIRRMITER